MLQWTYITHIFTRMCNYRKDEICKIKPLKWNCGVKKYLHLKCWQMVLNGLQRAWIHFHSHQQCHKDASLSTHIHKMFSCFLNTREESGGRAPLLSHCLFLPLWYYTWYYYFLKILPLGCTTQRSELKREWTSDPLVCWAGSDWLKRAKYVHLFPRPCSLTLCR